MSHQTPWVRLTEVISEYGMSIKSAGNAIHRGTFPVRTYYVGKFLVVDREVHAAYLKQRSAFYAAERAKGLSELARKKKCP